MLIENCIRDSKDMAKKYPELTRIYCSCSMDRIMTRFTKLEYLDIIKNPTEEQMTILLPTFQDCLTEYQNNIRNLKK